MMYIDDGCQSDCYVTALSLLTYRYVVHVQSCLRFQRSVYLCRGFLNFIYIIFDVQILLFQNDSLYIKILN